MLKSRKITCPKCGAMIEVGNPNLVAVRDINCPNPNCKALLHVDFDNGETILTEKKDRKASLGILVFNSHKLALQEGKNTIGRKDSKHTASIGIETPDKAMSRLHCQVENIRIKSGKVKSVLSDLRESDKIGQKPIMVNDEPLSAFDQIVLDDGDYIKLGDTVVRYRQK